MCNTAPNTAEICSEITVSISDCESLKYFYNNLFPIKDERLSLNKIQLNGSWEFTFGKNQGVRKKNMHLFIGIIVREA